MRKNGGSPSRWLLVVKADQQELFEILQARLEGSGIEVRVERRTRERRRGSLGPLMERRQTDRRRQRAVGVLSPAIPGEVAEPTRVAVSSPITAARSREAATCLCPTCASAIELDMPRFPHPPARVEMQVGHVAGNNQHYVEIAAFTVSGRLILSQRVPGRRSA